MKRFARVVLLCAAVFVAGMLLDWSAEQTVSALPWLANDFRSAK